MGDQLVLGDRHRIFLSSLPWLTLDSVVPLGEGLDNLAFEVNGELIVRFGKEPDPARRAERVLREARLLAAVAEFSPLAVPEPVFTAAEEGCLAYRKLPGVPLLTLDEPRRQARAASVGAALGDLLGALHTAPVARMAELVETDETPLAELLDEAAETYPAIAGAVPAAHRRAIEEFLAAPPPDGPDTLVFSHSDLGIEHVLVDPGAGTVTGVIDWSDAAITDPAGDLGLILRDLGPAGLEAALGSCGGRAGELRERALYHARCRLVEDLAYGLERGRPEYVAKSLSATRWLFPA
jgi:aminoglycoside phosphotransferase (APT) family kinase protein